MFAFKKKYQILILTLLLLILMVVYGWSRWQNLKRELGLEINWQGLYLNWQGINLINVTIKQVSAQGNIVKASGQHIRLSWSKLFIQQLDVAWQAGHLSNTQKKDALEPIDINHILKIFSWAPYHIEISQLRLTVPCPNGLCATSGKLIINQKQQPDIPLSLLATLEHQAQLLTIEAKLYQRQSLFDLQVTSKLNQQPFLSFANQFNAHHPNQWQGYLTIAQLSNSQGLLTWLQDWLPTTNKLTNSSGSLQVNAKWQLQFAKDFISFRPEQGYFYLDVSLTSPWPIMKVGYLQGHLKAAITFDKYPYITQLDSQIQITHPDNALVKKLPTFLQPDSISLTIKPLEIPSHISADTAIAMELKLTGNITTLFTSNIYINTTQKALFFVDSLLQADTKSLAINNYHLQNGHLYIPFTAKLTPTQVDIKLAKTALIILQQLTNANFVTNNLQLTLGNLITQLNYNDSKGLSAFSTKGAISASTLAFIHPLFKTTSWKIAGQLASDLKQGSFTGKITNGVDLSANVSINTDYQKQLIVTTKTPDLFFRTTNVFAKTFKDWPDVLEIVTGKININTNTTISTDTPITIKATANFNGLSGIYDRSEFRDLSGLANITLQNNQLKILLSDLALTEANPGFNMGPLQFNGQYTTHLNKLSQGILKWTKAELTLFTGHIWLKAGQIDLAKLPQQLELQINNMQLNDLLQAYPTEGLYGEGILDGTLPIIITQQGIEVSKGKLDARQAGFIKLNSPQIKTLAVNNPNMKLVTESLENFQFSLLNSQISYDDGKAILGLQIKGRNPDVKNGQPINLNITLQEDIPALMTTLQLSDRVSETIRQRVQKRLQQRASHKQ